MYNKVKLIGTLKEVKIEDINTIELIVDVARNSGVVDSIKVICNKAPQGMVFKDDLLYIEGTLYTTNTIVDGRNHLNLLIKAHTIMPHNGLIGDTNEVEFQGYIVKPPVTRPTPLGRTITELLVAINDTNKVSYYIPVITFGGLAERTSKYQVGNFIKIIGRLQSRTYDKLLPDGTTLTKTTYEVAARNSYIQTEVLSNDN
jgi:hypothetical protein